MHNLFILGSPRKNGNSETMAQTVADGLFAKGNNTVEYIRLNHLSIKPCQGCGGCSESGHCIIDDHMTDLYEKTDAADRIFFVSPIYFYGLSAQIKTYIDRCQAKWSRKYLLGEKYREKDKRSGHLLSCAATSGDRLFDGSILVIKCLCDALNISYGEPLLIRNLEPRTALQNKPEKLSLCHDFGKKIATDQHQI
ncbi:MAG: flavodoxin family protein [Desulfocapsa sp.]|nr:flavodoxin family protein [Desulfocapsa sp.]